MRTIPTCKICTHPERHAIEQALDWGWAYRVITDRWSGFSLMSLSRHQGHRAMPEQASPPVTPASATSPLVTRPSDHLPDVLAKAVRPVTSWRYEPPPALQSYGGTVVGRCAYCGAEARYLYFEGGWSGESRHVCTACARALAQQCGLTVPAVRP